MTANPGMREVLHLALRDANRFRLWLPLYFLSLLPGAIQAIPFIDGLSLRNPYLRELSLGGADAWLDAALSEPAGVPQMAALALALSLVYGGGYNFVSAALLHRWGGKSGYVRGGLAHFFTFAGIGALLSVLLLVSTVAAALLGGVAGPLVLVALVLAVQALNLVGEIARALAVKSARRNPFALLAHSIVFIYRNPGRSLAVAGGGAALHALLLAAVALAASWAPHPFVMVTVQQALVIAWLWVKILRLAWASHLVSAGGEGPLQTATGGSRSPAAA